MTAFAVLLAMIGLGEIPARLLARDLTSIERWMAAPLLGALPLAALVAMVGAFSYTPGSMLAVAAIPAGWGLWVVSREVSRWRRPLAVPQAWAVAKPLVAGAVVLLILAAAESYAPPSDHDTLRYHLALPRRDLELGSISTLLGRSVYEFFPPLASHLTRLAYALGGAAAAQLLNVVWMMLAMAWSGLLAWRLGGGPAAIAAAALLFAAQRVVLNLGAAATVDIPLAAYAAAAACVALTVLDQPQRRFVLLLGLLAGSAMAAKYHGGVVAAALFTAFGAASLIRRSSPLPFVVAGALGLLVIVPILARNWLVTGNPVFPILHPLFGPDNLDIFAPLHSALQARENVPGGAWALPWSVFIHQNAFDGLQFGFPFALAAIPFAFAGQRMKRLAVFAVLVVYGIAWWAVMPHLLRFHLPVLGLATALTALGLEHMARTFRNQAWALRAAWVGFLAVGTALQATFAASTAAHKLPVLLGLATVEQALERPAFVHYSLVSPCRWIEERLRPGERYLALVNDPSYYCPQASWLPGLQEDEAAAFYTRTPPPPVSAAELARRLETGNVRYVLAATNLGADDEPLVFDKHRYDEAARPVLGRLTPLLDSPSGRVYDARALALALRQAIEGS